MAEWPGFDCLIAYECACGLEGQSTTAGGKCLRCGDKVRRVELVRATDLTREREARERAVESLTEESLALAEERDAALAQAERLGRKIKGLEGRPYTAQLQDALARAEKVEAEVERLKSQIHAISQEP